MTLAIEALNPVESIEKNIYNNNDEKDIGLIDRISTGKNEEEMITNKLVVKEVILLRFYKEKTQSQVAKILGITQVQVSRIERKILNSMKVKLMHN